MTCVLIATPGGLLIARRGSRWTVEVHLSDRWPECVAIDPHDPARMYCGTLGTGLWRSTDAGRTWAPTGAGIPHRDVTAVAVSPAEHNSGIGVVYAGTEPSAVFRSDDGGTTWVDLAGLRALPSAATWSFPPRPDTHHVRWIEPDPRRPGRVFVAIEAGALVRTPDGGRTWLDRVPGGPYDTHTAATHRLAPGRVYSAAGDGYFESHDAGESWTERDEGLEHLYLVGIAVDPDDPETVIVSAADGPYAAYGPRHAEAYVYRRSRRGRWTAAMDGLPEAGGTVASRFATHPTEPGVVYAANNRGVFRSADAGLRWELLDIPWPSPGLADGVRALVRVPD
ncbi:MAG: hypothetical protein QN163_06495 [Armatimonadota bacterium]|nr:hypothetical protein [Armatimonadota bacterium]MDR5697426.1 hypothetical protein [Armatimonadota bacterium]